MRAAMLDSLAARDEELERPVGATAPRLPDISVLIVAYRSRNYIIDCIGSVYAHTRDAVLEILLIDNGDDGTAELVRAQFPGVRIIPSTGNLGFGRGINRLAVSARADKLLLLNPDTELRGDAIDRLLDFAETRPSAGAWGGVTVTPEGAFDASNRLVFPTLGRLARWAAGDGDALCDGGLAPDARLPEPVDVLSGGFMMVRRDVWERLDGFDESYFLYCEETDLFLRMKRLGLDVWATPDAVVVHDVGGGERSSPQRLCYRMTGLAHFVRTHMAGPKAALAMALIWFGLTWRWVFASLLSALPPLAARWRARRRGYGGLVWRPWRWWGGYAR